MELIYKPSIDVTGDLFNDYVNEYELNMIEHIPQDDGSRNIIVCRNTDGSIEMLATPYWSCEAGETYIVSLFKRSE